MSNIFVQLGWLQSLKQLSTTPLNSFKQSKTGQRPCTEITNVIAPTEPRIVKIGVLAFRFFGYADHFANAATEIGPTRVMEVTGGRVLKRNMHVIVWECQ